MIEDPYKRLANAIIIQAVTDYKKALRQLNRNDKYEPAIEIKEECEEFFHSEWFRFLTSLDPDYLLQGIARMAT